MCTGFGDLYDDDDLRWWTLIHLKQVVEHAVELRMYGSVPLCDQRRD